MAKPKKAGRPTDYSLKAGAEICAMLGDGKSLKEICSRADMPARTSVYVWLVTHQAFADMYARAREEQADTLADEIIDIADNPVLGIKTKTGKDGVEITEGDMIEHRRLQVDARKWVAAKLKPRKYGDKLAIGGAEGLPPVKISRIELVALGTRPDDDSKG